MPKDLVLPKDKQTDSLAENLWNEESDKYLMLSFDEQLIRSFHLIARLVRCECNLGKIDGEDLGLKHLVEVNPAFSIPFTNFENVYQILVVNESQFLHIFDLPSPEDSKGSLTLKIAYRVIIEIRLVEDRGLSIQFAGSKLKVTELLLTFDNKETR